ncbi:NAD-dependent deacetylase hst3 [Conoideocrella luteorostrata]|uniref:NAD-dependent deacetylase hst3 n=1 Tax=Conoideocrella luteorostrata TaxID=1105319 RepID=A0AAJ0CFZ4_9HYPO|nr:NAD-dependent deacetylase hst3 [Conoideocrella luteorostrata]
MPTQHVVPDAIQHLGDVANALLKARKVVVVTGAGISTNSGIPDFRSENGLYSLIQAQFDAASRQAHQYESSENEDKLGNNACDLRPAKRRKISVDDPRDNDSDSSTVRTEINAAKEAIDTEPILPSHPNPLQTEDRKNTAITCRTTHTTEIVVETSFSTPRPKTATIPAVDPTTSPLSSPPAEELILPPSTFRSRTRKRLTDVSIALSSSPLSSPPPDPFDPFIPGSPCGASSGRRSSTLPSEVDEEEEEEIPQNPFASSQGSNGSRSTMPNMKGKDLFDANIWSDPIRTSVFYKFATSLRQMIRSAEPTTSHQFISHLRDRGKLVRCYTQNIDQIEEKVGLSTRLQFGPGSRGRFSRRSTANTNQLNKMVEEADSRATDKMPTENSSQSATPTDSSSQSQEASPEESSVPVPESEGPSTNQSKATSNTLKKDLPRSGVECVFLHGSLDLLRCFLCGRVCSWDEADREAETLLGQQPECPHCVGATVAREEKGKRALGVGKLRPDIVLYGEEHPSSHLISPIVTHDLGLYPDMLLILGTSLRVHGLKVMVREFAKAVHSKGGKVIFVNFTKPPESIWRDIIDYWVQWDCDAWVNDLHTRIPKLWQEPEPPKSRKKRESSGMSEEGAKLEGKKPPAANPVALRDTKITGAYWTSKVLTELHRITGHPEPHSLQTSAPVRRASLSTVKSKTQTTNSSSESTQSTQSTQITQITHQKVTKTQQKRPRKSAPGALERVQQGSSALNPNHGRSRKKKGPPATAQKSHAAAQPTTPRTPASSAPISVSSILSSVKENPRVRKRKKIDGEEVPAPSVRTRRRGNSAQTSNKDELKLPPIQPPELSQSAPLYGKPHPLEPKSPPAGPLISLSANLRSASVFEKPHTLWMDGHPMVQLFQVMPSWTPLIQSNENKPPAQEGTKEEANAAMALAGLKTSSPITTRSMPRKQARGNFEGQLKSWGSSWSLQ